MSKQFTAEEVAKHTSRDDLWIIYKEKVYDVSQYLDEHPGGEEVIIDCAGQDSTDAFDDIGHSEDAIEQLKSLYIGDLIGGVKSSKKEKAAGSSDSNVTVIALAVVAIAIGAYFLL